MMRKGRSLALTLCSLLVASFLWGCGGGGPGSPGSSNTEDLGIILDASVVGTYLDTDGVRNVDVIQDICDPGPPPEIESFTDHGAIVTFTARLLNPTTTFQPGTLYVEKYTVEFRRSNDSIGAPPIETDVRFNTITIPPPIGTGTTTVTAGLILVDLPRKDKYRADMASGVYSSSPIAIINNYTAIYTFQGKNEFGQGFTLKAQMDFSMGHYDFCD